MESNSVINFAVGERFTSCWDLMNKIKSYERGKLFLTVKNDARTIERQLKLTPNKTYQQDIEYVFINFVCHHSG